MYGMRINVASNPALSVQNLLLSLLQLFRGLVL